MKYHGQSSALLSNIKLDYNALPSQTLESSEDITQPLQDVLNKILELTQNGDIKNIEGILNTMANDPSGKYRAFALHLISLAEDLHLIEIENFIEQYNPPSS